MSKDKTKKSKQLFNNFTKKRAIIATIILVAIILAVPAIWATTTTSQAAKLPTSATIVNALKTVDTVDGTCVVTEKNDPNGNLNKLGGYVAAVYFSDNRADLDTKQNPDIHFKDICDEGTDAGGSLEVYPNTTDAKKRVSYIEMFSTGAFGDGADSVYNTTVIRTSKTLTATQAKDLETQITDALRKAN